MSLMYRPWNCVPKAAVKNIGDRFKTGDFANWWRWIGWHYGWGGRQYGLTVCDRAWEGAPEVQEALRRLNIRDPYAFDQRHIRIHRATLLSMNNEVLPKSLWTQWDEESYYLEPLFDEIEREKVERIESSGMKPGYELKDLGRLCS